jgi:hypothetical protein
LNDVAAYAGVQLGVVEEARRVVQLPPGSSGRHRRDGGNARLAPVAVALGGVAGVLVEIGPERGLRHNRPLFSLSPLATAKDTTATSAKKEDAETKQHKEKRNGTLSRPKTEGTPIVFGALFLLQCVRSITRGSLSIVDLWV